MKKVSGDFRLTNLTMFFFPHPCVYFCSSSATAWLDACNSIDFGHSSIYSSVEKWKVWERLHENERKWDWDLVKLQGWEGTRPANRKRVLRRFGNVLSSSRRKQWLVRRDPNCFLSFLSFSTVHSECTVETKSLKLSNATTKTTTTTTELTPENAKSAYFLCFLALLTLVESTPSTLSRTVCNSLPTVHTIIVPQGMLL